MIFLLFFIFIISNNSSSFILIGAWDSTENSQKMLFLLSARKYIAERAETGVIYCPELEPEDLSGHIIKMCELCAKWKQIEQLVELDHFTNTIYLHLKSKNNANPQKTSLTILHTRRYQKNFL
jgi:hypothetical protein